ncbi:MAG TPA: hypothetical protein VGF01_13040, partial [Terracidiphilus sp.]
SYPEIAKRAKTEGAEIHWGDETAVVNTDVRGRGYRQSSIVLRNWERMPLVFPLLKTPRTS